MEPANEPEPEEYESDLDKAADNDSEANAESNPEPIGWDPKDALKSSCADATFYEPATEAEVEDDIKDPAAIAAQAPAHEQASDDRVEHQLSDPSLEPATEEGQSNEEPPAADGEERQLDSDQSSATPGPAEASVPQAATRGLRLRWWRRGTPAKGALLADGTGQSETPANNSAAIERWSVVDREGEVVAEDDGLPLTTGSVEAKIEQLLTWMLAPAVHGIPKLGVPGAVDRANELLSSVPGRDVESAVSEVVAGSEITVPLLVANFCLERIPFLGCPTVLLKNTWGNLRSILIIAALYGHDLEKPRTHHEALLCLIPPGEDPGARKRRAVPRMGMGFGEDSSSKTAGSPLVSETAKRVAQMTIKGALRRATGMQAAADCFELASILYSNCVHESVDEDGYVCLVATPASTARDFFRRKSVASSALLWCSLPLLLLGVASPHFFTVATLAPKAVTALQELRRIPRCMFVILLGMPTLLLAFHALSSAGGQRFQKWSPERFYRRVTRGREARMLQDAWPQIVTVSVFSLHAVLPAMSAYSALSMVLESAALAWGKSSPGWDRLHGIACMTLSFYSFCACVMQHMKNEKPELVSGGDVHRFFRVTFRFFSAAWAVMRACCILAAWTYALLAIDLAATHVEKWANMGDSTADDKQASVLGIIGPLAWVLNASNKVNPLWSEKGITFSLRIIGVMCQQRLVELLSRREVLLRLIGAERITAQTVCLLMKGVAVACAPSTTANPIQVFFDTVTPPATCCVLVVVVRRHAIVLGAALAIAPQVVFSGDLGSTTSFAFGLMGGACIAHTLLRFWYENQDDLDSPALRLALLVPGSVSNKAKDLLSGALTATSKKAAQMMAMSIIQRFIRWCFRPQGALTM